MLTEAAAGGSDCRYLLRPNHTPTPATTSTATTTTHFEEEDDFREYSRSTVDTDEILAGDTNPSFSPNSSTNVGAGFFIGATGAATADAIRTGVGTGAAAIFWAGSGRGAGATL